MIAHRFIFSPIRTGGRPIAMLSVQLGAWAFDVALAWTGLRPYVDISPRRRTFVLQWLLFSASAVRLPKDWRPPLMPEDGANPETIRLAGATRRAPAQRCPPGRQRAAAATPRRVDSSARAKARRCVDVPRRIPGRARVGSDECRRSGDKRLAPHRAESGGHHVCVSYPQS